jgi:hypothetical protein
MGPEQAIFVQLIGNLNSQTKQSARVLEIGSYDVNGSIRSLFSEVNEYTGIDLCAGPGVDLVANAHDLKNLNLGKFEIVISCETLEHDPNWRLTVKNLVESLSDNGVLIITCATTLRPEHGTPRTSVHESPGTTTMGWDHYQNVSVTEMVDHLESLEILTKHKVWENKKIFDLYCLVVPSNYASNGFVFPSDEDMKNVLDSTPFFFVALRWPIRVISKLFGIKCAEKFGLTYWKFLSKRFAGHIRSNTK